MSSTGPAGIRHALKPVLGCVNPTRQMELHVMAGHVSQYDEGRDKDGRQAYGQHSREHPLRATRELFHRRRQLALDQLILVHLIAGQRGYPRYIPNPEFVYVATTIAPGVGQNGFVSGRLFEVQHGILQGTDAFHGNFDGVSGLQRAHADGSSRGDQISGFKSHHLRNEVNEYVEREEEVHRRPILPQLAIHAGLNAYALPGIEVLRHHRADRTKGVESLGPSPLTIFFLEVARGHVIHARVAKDVRAHVLRFAQAVAALADHDSELAFVVHALRKLVGPADGVASGDDGRRRLEKDQWLLGNRMVQLFRVFEIIAAEANHLRRFHRRQQARFAQGQIGAVSALKVGPGTRSGRPCASDRLDAAHVLDETIAVEILVLKSAVKHGTSMNAYLPGTVSLASAERWLSLPRRSTEETE